MNANYHRTISAFLSLAALCFAPAAHAQRESACWNAWVDRHILESGRPVYLTEAGHLRHRWMHDAYQGERRYLDDATRDAALERLVAQIEVECQSPLGLAFGRRAYGQWLAREECTTARIALEAASRRESKTPRDVVEKLTRTMEEACGG